MTGPLLPQMLAPQRLLPCCALRSSEEQAGLIKFEWLHCFVVLVEAGGFSEASRRLFISQQALSKSLVQLEKQLDASLITRRPWQLTPAGSQFFAEAQAILARIERLEARYRNQDQLHLSGRLRLALPGEVEPLLDSCRQLLLDHPELTIQMQTGLSADQAEQQLLTQQLDLAILPGLPRSKGLKSLPYASSPLILVGAYDAIGCGQVHWQELSHIACQAPEPLGQLLQWPEAEFPRTVIAQADFHLVLDLVLAGHGVAWVPEYTVRKQLREGSLYRLGSPPFQRRVVLSLVWARAQGHKPRIQQAIQALRPD